MIYRSNLEAPGLLPYFRHQHFNHSCGHTFIGDPNFGPRCGWFTHDEAAILYHIGRGVGGTWLDIGARTGWTSAHLIAAGCFVVAIEPEFYRDDFRRRAMENIAPIREKYSTHLGGNFVTYAVKADAFFAARRDRKLITRYSGAVIDADHDPPNPANDARNLLDCLHDSAAVVIHDFQGPATWDAARVLIDAGFSCKIYWTPNMLAVCWRGFAGWVAPVHKHDPQCELAYRPRLTDGLGELLLRCQ